MPSESPTAAVDAVDGPAAPPNPDEQPETAVLGGVAVSLAPDVANALDPLDQLLAVGRKVEQITEDVMVKVIAPADSEEPTVKTKFTVRVLSSEEIEQATERCTRYISQGRGPKEKQVDQQKLQRVLVAMATIAPNLKDARLLSKFGVTEAAGVVGRIMLPGQVAALSDKIMEVSGYDDDVVEVAKG